MGYQEYRKDAMSCLGWHALGCRICWLLGVIFALLGVVAAAVNIILGLGAANWLLAVPWLPLVVTALPVLPECTWSHGERLSLVLSVSSGSCVDG